MFSKTTKNYNLLFCLLLIFTSVIGNAQETTVITTITINTLKQTVIGKDVQFVDIRTPKEYNAGYIDDAININSANTNTFTLEFQKLNKEKPVYIYCYSGGRSHRASKKLAAMGFKKIYDFKEGYKAWSNQ